MTYKIELQKGLFTETVTADYEEFWQKPMEGFSGIHHIELHGKPISETGYRSHFVYPDKITNVEKYISEMAEELSGWKVKSITKLLE